MALRASLLLQSGQIQLILGPMFSGKSTELIRRMRRQSLAKQRCIVLKSVKDQRFSVEPFAITHDQQRIMAYPVHRLSEASHLQDSVDCIGIDEGQFFEDIDAFSEKMASNGKIVIVAALDGTFLRQPFGKILNLVPLAESVTKLSAVCMECGADAAFTRRRSAEVAVEVVGGVDKYAAVCRSCWLKAHPIQAPTESASASKSSQENSTSGGGGETATSDSAAPSPNLSTSPIL